MPAGSRGSEAAAASASATRSPQGRGPRSTMGVMRQPRAGDRGPRQARSPRQLSRGWHHHQHRWPTAVRLRGCRLQLNWTQSIPFLAADRTNQVLIGPRHERLASLVAAGETACLGFVSARFSYVISGHSERSSYSCIVLYIRYLVLSSRILWRRPTDVTVDGDNA